MEKNKRSEVKKGKVVSIEYKKKRCLVLYKLLYKLLHLFLMTIYKETDTQIINLSKIMQ